MGVCQLSLTGFDGRAGARGVACWLCTLYPMLGLGGDVLQDRRAQLHVRRMLFSNATTTCVTCSGFAAQLISHSSIVKHSCAVDLIAWRSGGAPPSVSVPL
jgi:hypothetical protein